MDGQRERGRKIDREMRVDPPPVSVQSEAQPSPQTVASVLQSRMEEREMDG